MSTTTMIPPTIQVPETASLERDGKLMILKAQAMTVDSNEDYETAGGILNDIVAFRRAIEEKFKPSVEAANKAHKALTKLRAEMLSAPEEAERIIRGNMRVWDNKEEARRREEERRQQEELRRQEEAKREAEIKRLAAEGKIDEAQVVHEEPLLVPAFHVPKSTPKVAGQTKRMVWKFRIVDSFKVDRSYCNPDEARIRQAVNIYGKDAERTVGGIEVYQESEISVRR